MPITVSEHYLKLTGGRLRRQEEAKQENLLDWIRSKIDTYFFFYLGGYRIVNIYSM